MRVESFTTPRKQSRISCGKQPSEFVYSEVFEKPVKHELRTYETTSWTTIPYFSEILITSRAILKEMCCKDY